MHNGSLEPQWLQKINLRQGGYLPSVHGTKVILQKQDKTGRSQLLVVKLDVFHIAKGFYVTQHLYLGMG